MYSLHWLKYKQLRFPPFGFQMNRKMLYSLNRSSSTNNSVFCRHLIMVLYLCLSQLCVSDFNLAKVVEQPWAQELL